MDVEAEDWWIGGGGLEEARDGGSRPTASHEPSAARMSSPAALRTFHVNLAHYVEDQVAVLDGTAAEQSLCLGNVTVAIKMKAMIEEQLTKHRRMVLKNFKRSWSRSFL